MALSGELKDFGLLQLLTLVQVTGKTGSLTLERPGQTGTIYFEDGLLLRVKTSNSHSENLATALFKAGMIDADQRQLVESSAPTSEKAVALLLSDQGVLDREDVIDFVRERSLSDLYMLMTWPDGSFRMDVDTAPPDEDVTAPTKLDPILDKGRNYLNEWQLLNSYIPDLSWPLRLLQQPLQPSQELKLGLAEWRMVVSVAQELPLKEIARRMGLDEFQVRQVAYRLISAGLAEVPQPMAVPNPAGDERQLVEERSGGFWPFGKRK